MSNSGSSEEDATVLVAASITIKAWAEATKNREYISGKSSFLIRVYFHEKRK
jgi:hypothetical protein